MRIVLVSQRETCCGRRAVWAKSQRAYNCALSTQQLWQPSRTGIVRNKNSDAGDKGNVGGLRYGVMTLGGTPLDVYSRLALDGRGRESTASSLEAAAAGGRELISCWDIAGPNLNRSRHVCV